MPFSTVRRAVTAGVLTTALTFALSAQASADVGDEDIVRVRFTGVTKYDARPKHVTKGASWVSYLHLYTPDNKFVGDAGSRCSAVTVTTNRVTTQCTRVLRMKEGEIHLHDMIGREGKETITAKTAIVGGTGIYNDAEGEGYITLKGDHVYFDLHVDD
ncbi:hypothetical protein [Streptomyces sp. S.PNR 29]|uniref:hypothetical protein n=1 Tax=Streptomyces sp. S.PNR 29 TaxID=2973805 RepID=UPI0025AEDA7B|nr:hypothetical protein [Streptomyces sp. S.PNR 29]MDN0195485.1 hypothetical protein [Streptomyces sp. S.PNR 29]